MEATFFQGQNVQSEQRAEFNPSNGSSPSQSLYGTLDRTFTCIGTSEEGEYYITLSITVFLDSIGSTDNIEFSGYVETNDRRIDFTADKNGLDWDMDNGSSTGTVSLSVVGGRYRAIYTTNFYSEIEDGDTENLVHYISGSGSKGYDGECYINSNMTPIP